MINPLNIFKGKVDAGKLIESATKGIDKLAFTKEERSDFNLKVADKMAEFIGSTLSENTIRSKIRRSLALALIYNAIATFWFCVILTLIGINSKFVLDTFIAIFGSTSVIMVLAFFFGGYYMKGVSLNKKKD